MTDEQMNSALQDYRQNMYPRDVRSDGIARFSQPTFQIPPFMYTGPPTLAPGGGAEVLPLGGSMWAENSGFSFGGAYESRHYGQSSDAGSSSAGVTSSYSSLHKMFDYGSERAPSPSFQTSAPFDYDTMPTSTSMAAPSEPEPAPPPPPLKKSASFTAPSSLGLPVYSTSGFDVISLFGRISTRPNPQINLGPVDMTSSFVVVDVRRYDHPIVYCSPTFCTLTGYEEREILGKNCRFLQAPPTASVTRGEERRWTSNDAVKYMKKSLVANKDCQASVVNYRKNGTAFINLVTVIPVPEENSDPIYHLGFQVDLTEQPTAILDRLKDGSYLAANGVHDLHPVAKKPPPLPPIVVSDELVLPPGSSDDSHPLSMLVLSSSPDFLLVVSLKGVFLYVAPAVTYNLGYTPNDLLNKSLADISHPADVVPLMRELKDSSAPGEKPKPVDLLFRAKTSKGRYVWVECRGRLHVEPGKGRKAIVLSARVKEMSGLEAPLTSGIIGTVTAQGTILVVTRDIGGWKPEELVGRSFFTLFDGMRALPDKGPVGAMLLNKNGSKAKVSVRVWLQDGGDKVPRVYQITATPSATDAPFNVFEELKTGRESSWQYELQQLRFRNQRLQEQIRSIEQSTPTTSTTTTTSFTPAPSEATSPTFSSPFAYVDKETPTYPVSMPMWYPPTSLKRAWDGGTS